MIVSEVLLTPSKAQELLLRTPSLSRKLNTARVEVLARAMKRGEWRLTHQPIAIDKDGNLEDGQHRCAGCVRAGVPIPVLMATEVDPETYGVIDIGARRSPGDVLKLAGYTDASSLAAATRVVIAYRQGAFGPAPWKREGGAKGMNLITPTMIVRGAEEHPLLGELGSQAAAISKGIGRYGLKSGVLAGLVIIAEDSPTFEQLRWPWVTGLADGADLPAGSPLLAWRQWALVATTRTRGEVLWSLIKAWNYWQDGAFVSQMKISHGEKMPVVKTAQPAVA